MRLVLLILIACTLPLRAAPAPDANSILAAAQASAQKLKTTTVSYEMYISSQALSDTVIHVLQAPDGRRRLIFCKSTLGFQSELARLIERDNIWYATQSQHHVKYRPFEACFDYAPALLCYDLAHLRFFSETRFARTARLQSVDGNLASYAVPPSDPQTLQQFNDALKSAYQSASSAQDKRQLARMRGLVDDGMNITVDTSTGLLVRIERPQFTLAVANVKWLDAAPAEQFAVNNAKWEDRTDDPTLGDPNDLVMIAHGNQYVDGEILNLKTGRARRIPYRGASTLPGCFAKDRKSVFVCAWSPNSGGSSLRQINLKTGQNRILGDSRLAAGFTFSPVLSPDGATLACIHSDFSAGLFSAQVYLVDIATGRSKPLGQRVDPLFLSWLPDGKGLILERGETQEANQPPTATVSRLSLDGTVTPLFKGHNPLRIANSSTLLFRQNDNTNRWFTCDLDGKNPQLVSDGLPTYDSPTSSPDGKFILFLHFTKDKGPIPALLKLGNTQPTPIPVGTGPWSGPAWN